MSAVDAGLVAGAFALALAAIKLVETMVKKLRNGSGNRHPTEESRISAKLDSICRHTQASAHRLEELLTEQRKTADCLARMTMRRDVEDERHKAMCSQLDRIEGAVK